MFRIYFTKATLVTLPIDLVNLKLIVLTKTNQHVKYESYDNEQKPFLIFLQR